MQQLSLSLELPENDTINQRWFQEILNTLGVKTETAWPDRFGQALRLWLEGQGIPRLKTISLFSGGGGLDIAFHDSGFDIVQMIEVESKYIQTLEKNSGRRKWLEGSLPIATDIKNYLPEPDLKIDFIIGGPPCQTFSAAGRRAAGVSGITDSRGTLFQEYIRILKLLQPKGFLFENVYGITGANGGKLGRRFKRRFEMRATVFITVF